MAYREVDMLEVKDVLRRWFGGQGKKEIARQLGLDPRTVRRYLAWAQEAGFAPPAGESSGTGHGPTGGVAIPSGPDALPAPDLPPAGAERFAPAEGTGDGAEPRAGESPGTGDGAASGCVRPEGTPTDAAPAGPRPSPSPREVAAGERLEAAVAAVLARRAQKGRPRGGAWALCAAHRATIVELLAQRHLGRPLRLTRVHRLLAGRGVRVPYPTLRRFAIEELGHGRPEPSLPVADGAPGEELQLDTGWVGAFAPDGSGRRVRFKAWIFTPSVSRYRFVWPIRRETTQEAIEACEAAWRFYGGCFRVLIPDNTKAIVELADPHSPRIVRTFLEYSQARGLVVDPARVRHPKDKGRVERSVQVVRDACFAGEAPRDLDAARALSERWARDVAGMTRHRTTLRLPREHFEAVERPALLPAPTEPYDVPRWSDPVVSGQFVQVESALYSVPARWPVGERLRARADSRTVRLYDGAELVAVHARRARGERSVDPAHFPTEKLRCAQRDLPFFVEKARAHGDDVGRYAEALAQDAGKAHWHRQRHLGLLLRLVERLGPERVGAACRDCLELEVVDASRLERVLLCGPAERPAPAGRPRGELVPFARARFLRDPSAFALPPRSAAGGAPNPEKTGDA